MMQVAKPVGQGASVVKYDILTALLAMAAQDGGTAGRLALRLALLITARFNWRSGQFQVGQREIARLWGVTERTAKRELSQMRAQGWISVRRPAARGRVATHALHLDRIALDSMVRWPSVGPDFEARMTGRNPAPETDNVVPLLHPARGQVDDATPWGQASLILRNRDPALYHAWFARLEWAGRDGAVMHLAAPTPFVARYVETHFRITILTALAQCDPTLREVVVLS